MSWSASVPAAVRPQRCLKMQHRAGRMRAERKAGRAGLVDFLDPPSPLVLHPGPIHEEVPIDKW